MTTKPRSPLWYELPLLFTVIGGIIAFFLIRKDDPKKARNCIVLGSVLLIPFVIVLASFAIIGLDGSYFIVASSSMEPALRVNEVVSVDTDIPFEEIDIGDIIVFNRPSGTEKVILHRVVAVTDDDPKTLRTKGDANAASVSGTDFPITKDEYIGKVDSTEPLIASLVTFRESAIMNVISVLQIAVLVVPVIMHVKFVRSKKNNE